jgi:hypothetical protein
MPGNEEQAGVPDEPVNTGGAADEFAAPPAAIETPIDPNASTTATAMEVHHHPHIHHKKKWKEYVFEFFMLFLAVTAGFFVENSREHYVEHLRAKEYASMLHTDLVADTVIMNIISKYRNEQALRYDSLRAIIDTVPLEKINQQQLVRLSAEAGKYLHLIPNSGTLQQLKSSGSLRYFKNVKLVSTITSYEEDLKHGEYVQAEEKEFFASNVVPFKLNHFNFPAAEGIRGAASLSVGLLVNMDKSTLLLYRNMLDRSAWFNQVLGERNFLQHKKKAVEILTMLKEEYHLQ